MKQTNNAIKFLMAQYRAIFKNAYFKGLAAAAVVTMGLAAGAAQAADNVEIYGFTGGIAKGNWGPQSLTAAYKELDNGNIANTLNILQNSQLANLTKPGGGWTQAEFTAVLSGGLTHYSGSALKYDPENNFQATSIKHINIIGQHNIDTENNALLSVVDGSGRELTIGAGGVDLDIVRANYTVGGQTKPTGGAVFAGIAMNDGTKQMDLTVRNSTLNVTGQRYADHAVVAGYVANSSGTATSIGNTLNYQSTQVKQSSLSSIDTYGANLLAGFAQGTHGAIADSNTMNLGTELKNDATVDISQKVFFGGGYAKTQANNATGTASASNNIVNMSNFVYNTQNRLQSTTYDANIHIFGGFADNWGSQDKPNKTTSSNASNNSLTISNATIKTAADGVEADKLLIRGGLASSRSSGDGNSVKVTASNNTLTINGDITRDGYSTNLSLLNAKDTVVAGDARQLESANANVTAAASNNKLTIDTIKMEGSELIGGRAVVLKKVTGDGHTDSAEAINNVIAVTGDTILKNTSINAARIVGSNVIHSGNIASLDSNVLAIADGKQRYWYLNRHSLQPRHR